MLHVRGLLEITCLRNANRGYTFRMLPATPVVRDQDGSTQQTLLRGTVSVCSTDSNYSPSSVYLRSQQAASAAPSRFQLAASPASLRHRCSRLPIACIHAADAACPSAATADLSPRLLVTVPHALRRLRCMSAQAESVCCDAWVHTHRACKHVLRIGRTSRPAYKDYTQNVFTVLQSRSSGPHRSALLSAGCHVWRCIARNFHDSTPFSCLNVIK